MILIFLPQFKLVTKEYLQSKYEFTGVIARGAFGTVHSVIDVQEQQKYALKVLSKAQVNSINSIHKHTLNCNGSLTNSLHFTDHSGQFCAPIEE